MEEEREYKYLANSSEETKELEQGLKKLLERHYIDGKGIIIVKKDTAMAAIDIRPSNDGLSEITEFGLLTTTQEHPAILKSNSNFILMGFKGERYCINYKPEK